MKAARALAGWDQRQLAEKAGVDTTTVSRMEVCDDKPISGYSHNIVAVVSALEKAGIVIEPDKGVH